jgi:hypothetical protein
MLKSRGGPKWTAIFVAANFPRRAPSLVRATDPFYL